MSNEFARVAAQSRLLRRHIPRSLRGEYDHIVELALRQAVIPEVQGALDDRPLAKVFDFCSRSART